MQLQCAKTICNDKRKYKNRKTKEVTFSNPLCKNMKLVSKISNKDKYRIAILEKVLRTYISNTKVLDNNLSIYLFTRKLKTIENAANSVLKNINKKVQMKYSLKIEPTKVEAGSGSLPTEAIDSIAISIESKTLSPNTIAEKLRKNKIPIISYIMHDKVYIDFKAIHDSQFGDISKGINKCL